MNIVKLAKVGKSVGTIATVTTGVPGLLVKLGVGLAISLVTDVVAKKLSKKIAEKI